MYDIANDSWTTGSTKSSSKNKKSTNYVTMNDGTTVAMVSHSYWQESSRKIKTDANQGLT